MIRSTQKRFDARPVSRIGEVASKSRPALVRFLVPVQCNERLDGDDLPLLRERPCGEAGRMPVGESKGRRRIAAQGRLRRLK